MRFIVRSVHRVVQAFFSLTFTLAYHIIANVGGTSLVASAAIAAKASALG